MNTQELWTAVLSELELQLSKANFTTWFRSTFIYSFQNGEVIVAIPSTFYKSWIEKKYHKTILTLLQDLSPEPIRSVQYKVETHQRPPEPILPPAPPQAAPVQFTQNRTVNNNSIVPPTQDFAPTTNGLNPKYIFTAFIVGKGNELAHAAAQAVSTKPGTAYNPLFLYGGVGLGKTHLLQAIGHEMIKRNEKTRVLYVTCERFTNDFINAVRTGRAKDFKDLYRNVDLLLIDDIQFMAGKKETQEEFSTPLTPFTSKTARLF